MSDFDIDDPDYKKEKEYNWKLDIITGQDFLSKEAVKTKFDNKIIDKSKIVLTTREIRKF